MADTIKSAVELKLGLDFVDNDTRAISMPNPKENVTAEQVQTVSELFRTKNFFIGDKTGAAFKSITSAKKVETTKHGLDLS